jgi:23S rRNA (uracil1939-C5)-methyltransferase
LSEVWQGRVERLGWGGKGIARSADGRLILLTAPLAMLPGEEVEAELTWHARHAEGVVKRWVMEDKRRVEPRCPYALRCGGCSLWGVTPALRGELKREMAADLLRRMLPGAPEWQWLPAPPDALRQRIQLHWDGNALGYHAWRSHELVPVAQCPISAPELSAAIPLLAEALHSGALPNEPARWELTTGTPPGEVRASAAGKTWMWDRLSVAAATRRREVQSKEDGGKLPPPLINQLSTAEVSVTRAHIPAPLQDESPLHHHLPGAALQQHPRAFFQVTPAWAWRAFCEVFAQWQLGGASLFDLYGGGGFFSRMLGAQFQRFTLVESSPLSIVDAAANLAGLEAQLHAADVAQWIGAQPEGWASASDTVLLDPPRAGLPPQVSRAIAGCEAGTVVLIGCDGAAFCRDVRRICEGGRWRLDRLAIIDLFPNTPQVECVGLLRRG